MDKAPTGRFAPSPTGRLHAGNIFAYLVAWLDAKSAGGSIVLRVEDLDAERSKRELADLLMRDLERLGLTWDEGPYWQSTQHEAYERAFEQLEELDAVYPCFCTRAEAHVQSAPNLGERREYTGTCRGLSPEAARKRQDDIAQLGRRPSARLKMEDGTLSFPDLFQGERVASSHAGTSDPIVRRSDGLFAYQLAVIVDDAAQGIDRVVRGCDLLPSVPKQMRLQRLLGLPQPIYGHIPLLTAPDGRRLAKRDHDASMDAMVEALGSPEAVIGHIAHVTGIAPTADPITPAELLGIYDEHRLRELYEGRISIPFTLDQSNPMPPLANTAAA